VTAARDEERRELTLFVSGASDLSARAIADARRLCDAHLDGRYQLSVVDMHQDPAAVVASHVVAAPTLVKHRPLPVRRLVGDLSRADKVLVALDIPPATDAPRANG
jgi:circadian clock protein KaiB